MKIILILAVLLKWEPSFGMPDRVSDVIQHFNDIMMKCSKRIWSNYTWEKTKIVFVEAEEKSWVWEADTQTLNFVDTKILPREVLDSSYSFFIINEQKAMSLKLEEEETSEDLFSLAVHEFFHHLAQESWPRTSTIRGTTYPYFYEPRLFRRMLFDSLKSYFKTQNHRDLQKAKYWFEKWKTKFPNEYKNSADGYEGSAEYAETLALAFIRSGGCSASEETLKKTVEQEVENSFGHAFNGDFFMLDAEGYSLGGLASLILKFNDKNTQWQDQIAKGLSPLDLIFEDVASFEDKTNLALENIFKASAKKLNTETKMLLGQDLTNLVDKDFIRVYIPFGWLQSNFQPVSMILLNMGANDFTAYPLSTDHLFQSPDQKEFFRLSEKRVIFIQNTLQTSAPKCKDVFFTLIHKNELRQDESEYHFASSSLTAYSSSAFQYNKDGFTFLCVKH